MRTYTYMHALVSVGGYERSECVARVYHVCADVVVNQDGNSEGMIGATGRSLR